MSEAFPAVALPVPPLTLLFTQKQVSGKMLVTPRTPKATMCVPAGRRLLPARVQGRHSRCDHKLQMRGREAAEIEFGRTRGVSGERLFNTTAPNTPSYN